jgi:DNA-directed RNA polymerase subunit E'/Rpb7
MNENNNLPQTPALSKGAVTSSTIHELKIKQEYAIEYYAGRKPWELRKNDRNFKVGDTINFTIIETGCMYSRKIEYIFEGGEYGLEKGYCILTMSGYRYFL